jgi:anti-sigma B factor antagonist
VFAIEMRREGLVALSGRLDAAEAPRADEFLASAASGSIRVDLTDLEYISSAGISVILRAYKRLDDGGHTLTLVNPSPHVRNVFHYAGLDQILAIE